VLFNYNSSFQAKTCTSTRTNHESISCSTRQEFLWFIEFVNQTFERQNTKHRVKRTKIPLTHQQLYSREDLFASRVVIILQLEKIKKHKCFRESRALAKISLFCLPALILPSFPTIIVPNFVKHNFFFLFFIFFIFLFLSLKKRKQQFAGQVNHESFLLNYLSIL
jgi:hypothetical protein